MNRLVSSFRNSGFGRGDLIAVVVEPGVGLAVASDAVTLTIHPTELQERAGVSFIEDEFRPRWIVWSQSTASALVHEGIRVGRCWDISAVHRLLFGGSRADPALAWACAHDLPIDGLPSVKPPDLFDQVESEADDSNPTRPDGYLRPGWAEGGWASDLAHLGRWAELAHELAGRQRRLLAALPQPERALSTAHSESSTELLCAELAADGLPFDRVAAESSIAAHIGPRPRTEREAVARRDERDEAVLDQVPGSAPVDLRSPGQVKSLLRRVGIEVPDTRAWRLEAMRDDHPLVEALLKWRKAERVTTTYGYAWLDANVDISADGTGRLRGQWSGADGAAGRMTASVGLHNLPADMRVAVVADAGWCFVRSDLGQIEPRILAAISGDAALATATLDDDMYVPVATHLDVDRETAKVAVLGAMYGQTTGHGAQALRGLQRAYPVAVGYLEAAAAAAAGGHDLRTHGGRLVRMSSANANDHSERDLRSQAAARGRYGRNAMVQGSAAEFFKVWALTVRARAGALDGRIVLCLHDELLVHCPATNGPAVAELVDRCLDEAAQRWSPPTLAAPRVRFVAETSVISCWADAKS